MPDKEKYLLQSLLQWQTAREETKNETEIMKNTTSIIPRVKMLGRSSYFFKSIANPIQRIFIKTTENFNMFVILYLLRSNSHNMNKRKLHIYPISIDS